MKIKSITPLEGGADVVALRTNDGWYKTYSGISHNCDDIQVENDEAVLNEERRAKFREWFHNALLPAISDTGKIRIVGTILHFDSLLERLMPPTSGERAKFTNKNALCEWSEGNEFETWKSIKFRAHPDFDDFSELLWPEKFTEQRLRS